MKSSGLKCVYRSTYTTLYYLHLWHFLCNFDHLVRNKKILKDEFFVVVKESWRRRAIMGLNLS
jgi:hypothetical protein